MLFYRASLPLSRQTLNSADVLGGNAFNLRRRSGSRRIQQVSTATSSADTDLMRPVQARDLHRRQIPTFLPLVHTEVVTQAVQQWTPTRGSAPRMPGAGHQRLIPLITPGQLVSRAARSSPKRETAV